MKTGAFNSFNWFNGFPSRSRCLLLAVACLQLASSLAHAAQLRVMKMGLGAGTVSSSPAGITCGSDCDQNYASGVVVTLAAAPIGASVFVRWEGDVTGTANPTNVTMNGDRSVRAVFDLATPIPQIYVFDTNTGARSTRVFGPTDVLAINEVIRPEDIRDFITDHPSVNSPSRFLAALLPEFKLNWMLMTRSESLQTGTAESPRILLPSADVRFVFTIGMTQHSSYPGSHSNAVEYMQWDAIDKNFRFHEIVLDTIPSIGVFDSRNRGVSIDDAKCSKCHSTQNVLNRSPFPGTTGIPVGLVKAKNKPNWDSYDSWGGLMPFNRDRIFQGSVEAAAFRKIFNLWTWWSNDAVRAIIEQLVLQPTGVSATNQITRRVGGAADGNIEFSFDVTFPLVSGKEPLPSSTAATVTTGYAFGGTDPSTTTVTRGGSFVRLNNSASPGDIEGRGVDFFDLLGGLDGNLNAQRIADELLNHRFATGTFAIDVRPIALAIARGLVVRSGNTVIDNVATANLSVSLPFFDARNGVNLSTLATDTRTRAENLTRRKADIQKKNLDRSVDEYLAGAANGLIQQYGAATEIHTRPAPATIMDGIRQEVFRRRIDEGGSGDTTVLGGIYNDREQHSFNTEKLALFRYFLEPLGVSVDKWSMGVRGRSRTYTFADVFDDTYIPHFRSELSSSLGNPTDAQVINLVNSTLASLPAVNQVPFYTDVQRIFNKSCIECHGGLGYPPYGAGFLDLSEDEDPPPTADSTGITQASQSGATVNLTAPWTEMAIGRLIRWNTGEEALIVAGSGLTWTANPAQTVALGNFGVFRIDKSPRITRSYDRAVAYTTMDPATSFLYQRITATTETCPGGLMPCGGPALSNTDTNTIHRWIVGPPSRPYTSGDPHIRTVDGVNYDFQAVGEFVLLRDEYVEIQSRQTAVATDAPLGPDAYTGLTSCVSINTAVALAIGNDRITYEPNLNGEPDPRGLQLRINGELIRMPDAGIPLSSGVRITRTLAPGGIQIEAPGGAVIVITPGWWNHYQLWYLNIDVRHIRATMGLMGTIAPGNWLPALPDGTLLGARPANLQDRYQVLYGKFGNSWRVNDSTSLFDYAPGTSTRTFTVAQWPNGQSPQSCKAPPQPGVPIRTPQPPLPRAEAEQACSGIVDKDRRAACVQDVMVTGERGFGQTYLLADRIDRNAYPAPPILVSPESFATDVARPATFAWKHSTDADGDPVSYKFYLWPVKERPNNNNGEPIPDSGKLSIRLQDGRAVLEWDDPDAQLETAGDVNGPWDGIGNAKSPFWMSPSAKRQFFRLAVKDIITKTVSGLKPGEAYFWKVIVEDGKGGTVESETRRLEIR